MKDTVKRKSIDKLQAKALERATPPKPKKRRDPAVPKVTKRLVRKVLKAARG